MRMKSEKLTGAEQRRGRKCRLLTTALGVAAAFAYTLALVGQAVAEVGVIPTETVEVGSIPGAFDVGASGQATFSVPIALEPGRAGLTPTLSLEYDSTLGNAIAGVGWSIGGLSAITRCPKTIRVDGALSTMESDVGFCLDGVRLVRVDDAATTQNVHAEYRTLPDGGMRLRWIAGSQNALGRWEIDSPEGRLLRYTPGVPSRIERVTDRDGNYIAYGYDPQLRLQSISYNHSDNTLGAIANDQVDFEYQGRPDPYMGFRPWSGEVEHWGSEGQYDGTQRLAKIKVKSGGIEIRRYELGYDVSGGASWPAEGTGRSLLGSVKLCRTIVDGAAGGVIKCVPASTFGYNQSVGQFDLVIPRLPRLVTEWVGEPDHGFQNPPLPEWPSAQSLFERLAAIWKPLTSGSSETKLHLPLIAADFDADGTSDLMFATPNADGSGQVWTNAKGDKQSQFLYSGVGEVPAEPLPVGIPAGSVRHTLVNLRGDGRPEFFYITERGTLVRYDGVSYEQLTADSNAFITDLVAADMDGDGRQELLTCQGISTKAMQWVHWINLDRGSDGASQVVTGIACGYANTMVYDIDFNGADELVQLSRNFSMKQAYEQDKCALIPQMCQCVHGSNDEAYGYGFNGESPDELCHIPGASCEETVDANCLAAYIEDYPAWNQNELPNSVQCYARTYFNHCVCEPENYTSLICPPAQVSAFESRTAGSNCTGLQNECLPAPSIASGSPSDGTDMPQLNAACVGEPVGSGRFHVYNMATRCDMTAHVSTGEIVRMNGDGEFELQYYSSPLQVFPGDDGNIRSRNVLALADFNGDGLVDVLWRHDKEQTLDLAIAAPGVESAVDGFLTSRIKTPAGSDLIVGKNVLQFVKVTDFDLDGRSDLLIGDPLSDYWWAVFFREGAAGSVAISHQTQIPFEGDAIVADANGDGLLDLIVNLGWGLDEGPSDDWKIWVRRGPGDTLDGYNGRTPPDLLTEATDGFGATAHIRYANLADVAQQALCQERLALDSDAPFHCRISPRAVVSRNWLDGLPITERIYRGATYDRQGGLLGFLEVESVHHRGPYEAITELVRYGQLTHYNTQFNGFARASKPTAAFRLVPLVPTSLPGERYQLTHQTSAYLDITTAPVSGLAIDHTFLTYANATQSAVYTTTELPDFDALSDSMTVLNRTVTVVTDVDAYGHPERVATTTHDGDLTEVTRTYSNDTTNWLLGFPKEIVATRTVDAEGGDRVATRTTMREWIAGKARLHRETREPGDLLLRSATEYYYDGWGNLRSMISKSGFPEKSLMSTFKYGVDGLRQTESTDPAGNRVEYTYSTGGLPLATHGPSGVGMRFEYDMFGRRIHEIPVFRQANGVITDQGDAATTRYERILPGVGPTPVRVRTETASGAEAWTDYDSVGRPVLAATAIDGGVSTSILSYDGVGRLEASSSSEWLVAPAAAAPAPPGATATFQYDNLDRPRYVTDFSGAVTEYRYEGRTTEAIKVDSDPLQVQRRTFDERGRVVSSVDGYGSPDATSVCLSYGAHGSLWQVHKRCQDGQSPELITTIQYDKLGRKRFLIEPLGEGTREYRYREFDQLFQVVDGNDEVTERTYDALGRVTKLTTTADNQSVEWGYDGAFPGSLDQITTKVAGVARYTETLVYDSLRRPTTRTIALPLAGGGEIYAFGQTYDALGRPSVSTYPNSPAGAFSVQSQYSADGNLQSLTHVQAAKILWQRQKAFPNGALARVSTGDGHLTKYQIDSAGRLLSVLGGAQAVVDGPIDDLVGNVPDLVFRQNYAYTPHGMLDSKTDLLMEQTLAFTYDAVGRMNLVHAGETGGALQQTVDVDYNALGAMERRNDTGAINANASGKVFDAGDRHFIYDGNGAVVSVTGTDLAGNTLPMTLSYTGAFQTAQIATPAGTIDLQYDPSGTWVRRIRWENDAVVEGITRIAGFEKVSTADGPTKYKYLIGTPSGHAIQHTVTELGGFVFPAETLYVYSDYQGSGGTVTAATGDVVSSQRYDVWGRPQPDWLAQPQAAQGPVDAVGFTGYDAKDLFGMIHANGRVYDPFLGHFTSADPIVQAPGTPMSHNRYIYAWGDPVNNTDPTGYLCDHYCNGLPASLAGNPFTAIPLMIGMGALQIAGSYAPNDAATKSLGVGKWLTEQIRKTKDYKSHAELGKVTVVEVDGETDGEIDWNDKDNQDEYWAEEHAQETADPTFPPLGNGMPYGTQRTAVQAEIAAILADAQDDLDYGCPLCGDVDPYTVLTSHQVMVKSHQGTAVAAGWFMNAMELPVAMMTMGAEEVVFAGLSRWLGSSGTNASRAIAGNRVPAVRYLPMVPGEPMRDVAVLRSGVAAYRSTGTAALAGQSTKIPGAWYQLWGTLESAVPRAGVLPGLPYGWVIKELPNVAVTPVSLRGMALKFDMKTLTTPKALNKWLRQHGVDTRENDWHKFHQSFLGDTQ